MMKDLIKRKYFPPESTTVEIQMRGVLADSGDIDPTNPQQLPNNGGYDGGSQDWFNDN